MGPGKWISHGGRRKGTEPIQNRGKGPRGRHQEGRARTVPPHLASPQGPADGTCHQENAGDVLWASLGPREAGAAGGEPESPNDCASSRGCPDRNLRSGSFPKGRPSATGKAVRLHRVPDLSPCSVLPYPHFHANKLRSGLRSLPKATVTWVHIATRPVQAGPTAPSPGPLGLMRKLDWASVSLEGKASVSPHQEMEGSRPPR